MFIKYLKDFSLFLLLFVSFNDTFAIELTGYYIIKVVLAIFVVLHYDDYIKMLFEPKSRPIKAFYIFMLTLLVITLLSNIFYLDGTLTTALTRMFGFFALFVYFSYTKELDKALYMLWAIMIFSAIVAYFSDPVGLYTFRKTGATEDPNSFATQLLTVMFVTVYLFQKNKNWFFLFGSLGLFTYTLLYAGLSTHVIGALFLIQALFYMMNYGDK